MSHKMSNPDKWSPKNAAHAILRTFQQKAKIKVDKVRLCLFSLRKVTAGTRGKETRKVRKNEQQEKEISITLIF